MKLSKKLASIGLAVAMVASIGATSVFAANIIKYPTQTDYGTMYSSNIMTSYTNVKYCTVITEIDQNVSTILADLTVVSYPSGQTLYSGGSSNSKSNYVLHGKNVYTTDSITTYGAHQVWGASAWGHYTSQVNI